MLIETPLLVVGSGAAALVVAKIAAGAGSPCLLVGHEITGGDDAVELGPDAVATLERHGILDVLRPCLVGLAIAPRAFEEVIKHHCVADVNVTVYDGLQVIDRVPDGAGLRAVLTDGRARWNVVADAFVDASSLPRELPDAVVAGAAVALAALTRRATR